ncbi:formyltransferase family protein [Gammaproteobacteria bacterium]|nr:formyltransferase family protein [Gammaproteobacteria bacterium]
MIRINEIEKPTKKILFLGYNQSQTKLIDALVANNCIVDHSEEKFKAIKGYDCVVSYGYRQILKQNVIDGLDCPIFNLHISYLPYNRGAHPNFWSFYDNTPSGVTIHLIDSGVDTGQIVKQKYVNFQESDDTFAKTYSVLTENIENLFLEFLPLLLTDTWTTKKQRGIGTHHYARDLPTNFSGWNSVITEELSRLDNEGLLYDSQ